MLLLTITACPVEIEDRQSRRPPTSCARCPTRVPWARGSCQARPWDCTRVRSAPRSTHGSSTPPETASSRADFLRRALTFWFVNVLVFCFSQSVWIISGNLKYSKQTRSLPITIYESDLKSDSFVSWLKSHQKCWFFDRDAFLMGLLCFLMRLCHLFVRLCGKRTELLSWVTHGSVKFAN